MRNNCRHKKPFTLTKADGKIWLWCGACGAIKTDSFDNKKGVVVSGKWNSPQLALGKPIS
jgi:hypothetical protein